MLVSELATFVNEPDRFTPHLDAEGWEELDVR